jgi:hypothetical protein
MMMMMMMMMMMEMGMVLQVRHCCWRRDEQDAATLWCKFHCQSTKVFDRSQGLTQS